MGEEETDEDLMARYRDGDARAFDVLYRRHRAGLYRYLLRLCRHSGIAEELFQDVWSNVIRSRERYRPSARFTTFLYQIAHNRAIDHLRRKPELALVPEDPEEGDPPEAPVAAAPEAQPEAMVERKRLAERLLEQIAGLPAPQREAFLLREEAGLSLEEIAAATGVSAETAKSRLRYAVAKLRDGLKGLDDPGQDK
jgi:RNA polymerase sigma-70 factor (ECF subfamily)